MNGVKHARIKRCHECPYRIQKHASQAGPHGYSIFCTFRPDTKIELYDSYMSGLDTNCPGGFWISDIHLSADGLVSAELPATGMYDAGPADAEGWEAREKARQDARLRELAEKVKRVLAELTSEKDKGTALVTLTLFGIIRRDMALAIAEETLRGGKAALETGESR